MNSVTNGRIIKNPRPQWSGLCLCLQLQACSDLSSAVPPAQLPFSPDLLCPLNLFSPCMHAHAWMWMHPSLLGLVPSERTAASGHDLEALVVRSQQDPLRSVFLPPSESRGKKGDRDLCEARLINASSKIQLPEINWNLQRN